MPQAEAPFVPTREQFLASLSDESGVNLDAPAAIEQTPAGEKQADPAKPATQEAPPAPEPKPAAEDKGQQQPPPPKNPKEADRLEKTWKSVNEEKARIRQEREQWERDQRDLEEFRRNKLTSQHNSEAEQYDKIAQELESEGKSEAAQLARQNAREVRQKAEQAIIQDRNKDFQAKWQRNYELAAEANPELHDHESDLYKATEALIRSEPVLQSIPDGIPKAVQFVKMQMAASRAADLEAKLAEKEARIKELSTKMSLGGESSGQVAGEKSFDQMNEKERREHLFRQAQAQEN